MTQSLPQTSPLAPHPALAPWLALGLVLAWTLFAALVNNAQHGDNFEQSVWAHSLEWGYHKHPPLPTWLLGGWQRLLGESPWSTYAVAGMCTVATGWLTWSIGRVLVGPGPANTAVLLWGLHHAYSWKAQVLNHNTVMMVCIAGCARAALQALASQGARAWLAWTGVGLAGGAALLAKYQSAIPLAGILLAIGLGGAWREVRHRRGTAAAVLLALVLFSPHLAWLVQHDFITLQYASLSAKNLGPLERLARIVVFLLLQVRVMSALLAAAGLWLLWQRRRGAAALPPQNPAASPAAMRRAWLIGLIVFPLATVLLVCLVGGVRLQDHWGFQPLQFISLWLAWRLRGVAGDGFARLVLLVLAAHTALAVTYARPAWDSTASTRQSRAGQYFFPAQALADQVMADWRAVTTCPLRFVVGPPFEAGIVSVYSRSGAQVFEHGQGYKSPWVEPAALASAGAVHIERDVAPEVSGAVKRGQADPAGRGEATHWAIVPPQAACSP
jgi:4-amino-4-deoxy-L-arabinose transferase-like glycosyltransferase